MADPKTKASVLKSEIKSARAEKKLRKKDLRQGRRNRMGSTIRKALFGERNISIKSNLNIHDKRSGTQSISISRGKSGKKGSLLNRLFSGGRSFKRGILKEAGKGTKEMDSGGYYSGHDKFTKFQHRAGGKVKQKVLSSKRGIKMFARMEKKVRKGNYGVSQETFTHGFLRKPFTKASNIKNFGKHLSTGPVSPTRYGRKRGTYVDAAKGPIKNLRKTIKTKKKELRGLPKPAKVLHDNFGIIDWNKPSSNNKKY